MNYQKRFLLLLSIFAYTSLSTLEAVKVYLIAGKYTLSIDNEDATTHCIYGMPFDETDNTLLAFTFDTRPRSTCYIGQAAWLAMFQEPQAQNLRAKWMTDGLCPASRKVIGMRIFKRISGLTSFYNLENFYYIQTLTSEQRAQLIGATREYHRLPDAPLTAVERAAIPDTLRTDTGEEFYGDDFGTTYFIPRGQPVAYENGSHRSTTHTVTYPPIPMPAPEFTPYQAARELRAMPVPEWLTADQWERMTVSLEANSGDTLRLGATNLTSEQLRRIIVFLPEILRDSIKILDIPNNQLTTLPPEIATLRNLRAIYIYGNQIANLPEEITHLNHLTELLIDPHVVLPTGLIPSMRIDRVPDPLHPGAHLSYGHGDF